MKPQMAFRHHVSVGALSMAAVVALCVSSLTLNYTQHRDFKRMKATIYSRCSQRISYDTANHQAVGTELAYLQAQQRQAQANRATTDAFIIALAPSLRPALRRIEADNAETLAAAIAGMERAYAASVIGNCTAYK